MTQNVSRESIKATATAAAMIIAQLLVWSLPADAAKVEDPLARSEAKQLLDQTGIRGGLVVHVECGDGHLTAALRVGPAFLVQGLNSDPAQVELARRYVQRLGLYGPVSINQFDGQHLPFIDNVVNLLVLERESRVSQKEALRVLVPGGKLCQRQEDGWKVLTKPWPEDIDQWTHYRYDASGNPVAHDLRVGPPRRFHWVAEPRHARSHEHLPTIMALVSSNGRIFYLADEAPTISIRWPAQWRLVARDAFNGLLLWERKMGQWYPHIINWGMTPRQIQRRLVAEGDRLFVTLGYYAPISQLDAVTGKTLKEYDQTAGADEIIYHKGVLLTVVREVTPRRLKERQRLAQLEQQDGSPLFTRDTAAPVLASFRSTEASAGERLLALDADSGRILWQIAPKGKIRPLTLAALGQRVFYQTGNELACVDLQTGRTLWRRSAPPFYLVYQDRVLCAGKDSIVAISAEDGRTLWSQKPLLVSIHDVFVAADAVWVGGFKSCPGKRSPAWCAYCITKRDLQTGAVLKHIEPENPGHHHRCYFNKATDRYILGGRRGTEFVDLQTGEVLWNSWVRGVCKYGVMPANGLFYAPPHACGCYVTAKLAGFYALEADGCPGAKWNKTEQDQSGKKVPSGKNDRLVRGPAYGKVPAQKISGDQWPTYRHDAARSGATPASVPPKLRLKWKANLVTRLSSLTVANGQVFLAEPDRHSVVALDCNTGRVDWQFTTGGPVDSPPTIFQGRAIFGSHDGAIYSVRAADGELDWRLQAARDQRRAVAWGQVESVWPVLGSVLVDGGVVFATAGRSSYLDGGIDLLRVDATTGRLLSTTNLYSPDPKTDRQPPQQGPARMPGVKPDILSADDQYVFLRETVFDKSGQPVSETRPHLLTVTGFLDDTWPHRSYWIYGTHCSLAIGCAGRDRNLIYGRLLAFDDKMIYGYGRAYVHWSNQLEDKPYRLFAVENRPLAKNERPVPAWEVKLPILGRALVKTADLLFVAGPDRNAYVRPLAFGPDRGARLLAVSAQDGKVLASYSLPSPPVHDGLIALEDQLFLALENGQVVCWTAEESGK